MTGQRGARRGLVRAMVVRPWLGAVAATLLLTVGCGLSGDPVRDRWASRAEFPSCGEVSLGQGERMQQKAGQEIACLQRALKSGESAELKVSQLTLEGDPIIEYYRLTPQRTLEVYTDSTGDSHSDQKWSFAECFRPEWLPEISCGQ